MAEGKHIYRVTYVNRDKVYELFCEKVYSADMWGFIVLEDFVFGSKTDVLIDPAEEKLKQQFDGVERSFVPLQAIIQIDQVEKRGTPRISDAKGTVTAFPTLLSKG